MGYSVVWKFHFFQKMKTQIVRDADVACKMKTQIVSL